MQIISRWQILVKMNSTYDIRDEIAYITVYTFSRVSLLVIMILNTICLIILEINSDKMYKLCAVGTYIDTPEKNVNK